MHFWKFILNISILVEMNRLVVPWFNLVSDQVETMGALKGSLLSVFINGASPE